MKRYISKSIASVVAVAMFSTNVAFVHATETNIWSDRKKPVQVASLPSSLSDQLIHGMPAVAHPMGSISQNIQKQLPQNDRNHFASLVASLPQTYGSVRSVNVPSSGGKHKTVFYLQDVHMNAEAQENLGQTMQSLLAQKNVGLVALEGGFSPIDFSTFHRFSHPDSVRAMADYLLSQNRISGPVHAAFTTPTTAAFVGVDNAEHYNANVEAYRVSEPLMASTKEKVAAAQRKNSQRKATVYNTELRAFDTLVASNRSEKISWGAYVKQLSEKYAAPTENVSLFLKALAAENAIDFKAVERERSKVISQLAKSLTPNESKDLMSRSVAYRMGTLSHTDFYSALRRLSASHGIAFADHPALDNYVRYVLLSDAIDVEKVLSDVSAMEKSTYARLTTTTEEQQLTAESNALDLASRLVAFSLTRDEWTEYKKLENGNSISTLQSLNLSSFERFYSEAEQRDHSMADNLVAAMDRSNASVAVLVTGGFHSAGMVDLLKKQGVATIVYAPKITKVEDLDSASYLSVFTQTKTPLDKLFQGEKLFTAPKVLPGQTMQVATDITAAHAVAQGENPADVIAEAGLPTETKIEISEGQDATTSEVRTPSHTTEIKVDGADGKIIDSKLKPSGSDSLGKNLSLLIGGAVGLSILSGAKALSWSAVFWGIGSGVIIVTAVILISRWMAARKIPTAFPTSEHPAPFPLATRDLPRLLELPDFPVNKTVYVASKDFGIDSFLLASATNWRDILAKIDVDQVNLKVDQTPLGLEIQIQRILSFQAISSGLFLQDIEPRSVAPEDNKGSGMNRRSALGIIGGFLALSFGGKTTQAQQTKAALSPSNVGVVINEDGAWLNVDGTLWSGTPGVAYSPVPDNARIEQYNGFNQYLFKVLLPAGGAGIRNHPNLVVLAKAANGARAQNHAAIMAQQGIKYIRTYNLTGRFPGQTDAQKRAELQALSELFLWMYEAYGIRFTAGMYDPTDADARLVVEVMGNNPGLLMYEGWNEFNFRPAEHNINARTYEDIDRIAGVIKAADKNRHPVGLVITQSINGPGVASIKKMRNVGVIGLTIYDKTGAEAAATVKRMQEFFGDKLVGVSEIGVPVENRNRDSALGGIAAALTQPEDQGKAAASPFVTIFEFTPEKWKAETNDNRWWILGTKALDVLGKTFKTWKPGPKATDAKPAAKPANSPSVKAVGPAQAVAPFDIHETYQGGNPANGDAYRGVFGKISEAKSQALLSNGTLSFEVGARAADFAGFHIDLKGQAEVGVYSLFVKKEGGRWQAYRTDGKTAAKVRVEGQKVVVDVPVAEVRRSMNEIGAKAVLTQIHVQSGQQQNGVVLNPRPIPILVSVSASANANAEVPVEAPVENPNPVADAALAPVIPSFVLEMQYGEGSDNFFGRFVQLKQSQRAAAKKADVLRVSIDPSRVRNVREVNGERVQKIIVQLKSDLADTSYILERGAKGWEVSILNPDDSRKAVPGVTVEEKKGLKSEIVLTIPKSVIAENLKADGKAGDLDEIHVQSGRIQNGFQLNKANFELQVIKIEFLAKGDKSSALDKPQGNLVAFEPYVTHKGVRVYDAAFNAPILQEPVAAVATKNVSRPFKIIAGIVATVASLGMTASTWGAVFGSMAAIAATAGIVFGIHWAWNKYFTKKNTRSKASSRNNADLKAAVAQMAAALKGGDVATRVIGVLPDVERFALLDLIHPKNTTERAVAAARIGELLKTVASEQGLDLAKITPEQFASLVWTLNAELNGVDATKGDFLGHAVLPLDPSLSDSWDSSVRAMLQKGGSDIIVLAGAQADVQKMYDAYAPQFPGRLQMLVAPELVQDGKANFDALLPLLRDNQITRATLVFQNGFILSSDYAASFTGNGFDFEVMPLANYIAQLMGTAVALGVAEQLQRDMVALINA